MHQVGTSSLLIMVHLGPCFFTFLVKQTQYEVPIILRNLSQNYLNSLNTLRHDSHNIYIWILQIKKNLNCKNLYYVQVKIYYKITIFLAIMTTKSKLRKENKQKKFFCTQLMDPSWETLPSSTTQLFGGIEENQNLNSGTSVRLPLDVTVWF